MEKNSQEPERRQPDKKAPPMGNNFIWYVLALAIGVLFVVNLAQTKTRREIAYMELYRLIEKGAPEQNPDASIEVTEGPEGKQEKVRYWNLSELEIGPYEIEGKVNRQVIGRRRSPRKRRSSFAPTEGAWKTTTGSSLSCWRRRVSATCGPSLRRGSGAITARC